MEEWEIEEGRGRRGKKGGSRTWRKLRVCHKTEEGDKDKDKKRMGRVRRDSIKRERVSKERGGGRVEGMSTHNDWSKAGYYGDDSYVDG